MSRIELMIRRQEIAEAYFASDTVKLFARIKVYELGYRVFLLNFDDWERTVASKMPADPIEAIRMGQDRSWVEPYLVDLTRAMHNFVASALTLVDTTRVMHREIYEPQGLIPEHQEEISKRFINDGLSHFVKDLRQFCQHYRLPLVSARLGLKLDQQEGNINLSVPINRKQLEVFGSWSAPSKSFIAKHETEIDLEAVFKAYRDKVVEFNSWMESKQRDVHQVHWEYRDETDAAMAELTAQIAALTE